MRAFLLGILLLLLASPAYAPFIPGQADSKIPHELEGKLIIYRVGYTQCSMFLSKEGMAKGTVAPSCVLIPIEFIPRELWDAGFPFQIMAAVETEGD